MTSGCSLTYQFLLSFPSQRLCSSGVAQLRFAGGRGFGLNWCELRVSRGGAIGNSTTLQHVLVSRAAGASSCSNAATSCSKVHNNLKKSIAKIQEIINVSPHLQPSSIIFTVKRKSAVNFLLIFCIVTTCLFTAVRIYVVKSSKKNRPGSVADLVRRGQLRSDRRGISKTLKYEDPFNNPLMKVGKGNSTVEMCGKVYRLAPVTLTEDEQAVHQRRRSRAYQWKRPKVFLKEGDTIPPDVDPDTIRWIPANHPFATTVSDIDEGLAQNNVYQKHGVPFRIKAEHEALQRKLEALQNDQKLNKLVIDPVNAQDFERVFKSQLKSHEEVNQSPQNGQDSDSKPPKSDQAPESRDSSSASG